MHNPHAETPASAAQAAAPVAPPRDEPALRWHDVTRWNIEGRAFADLERERWFDRLPAAEKGRVPDDVWLRSRESAGMLVRFRTDATVIWADYTLLKAHLTNPNMTAIGSSGIDLYARDKAGMLRWVGVTRPRQPAVRQSMISGAAPGMREYTAYLPLYNGVEGLAISVPPEAAFEPLAPRSEKPIVFYGTSITHGASASRPGMAHTAILGRRLDRPFLNFGFGGVGRMDASVGEFLAKIDAAVYVIDCLPNMNAIMAKERCIPFVQQLRAARPDTPIVLVEDRRNTNSWIHPERNRYHADNHAALRECFAALQAQGVAGLHYLSGDELFGIDGEGATDGSHPSDLGFMRQADQFEPVLRTALGRQLHRTERP